MREIQSLTFSTQHVFLVNIKIEKALNGKGGNFSAHLETKKKFLFAHVVSTMYKKGTFCFSFLIITFLIAKVL